MHAASLTVALVIVRSHDHLKYLIIVGLVTPWKYYLGPVVLPWWHNQFSLVRRKKKDWCESNYSSKTPRKIIIKNRRNITTSYDWKGHQNITIDDLASNRLKRY